MIKNTLKEVVVKQIWDKNKFLTIFNEFYKNVNLLQRESTRGVNVEPNNHTHASSKVAAITSLTIYNVNVKTS